MCPSVACMFCVRLLCVCVGEWPWWCHCQRGAYVRFSVCVSGWSWVCGGDERGSGEGAKLLFHTLPFDQAWSTLVQGAALV
jgi:hypothetical protein